MKAVQLELLGDPVPHILVHISNCNVNSRIANFVNYDALHLDFQTKNGRRPYRISIFSSPLIHTTI